MGAGPGTVYLFHAQMKQGGDPALALAQWTQMLGPSHPHPGGVLLQGLRTGSQDARSWGTGQKCLLLWSVFQDPEPKSSCPSGGVRLSKGTKIRWSH